jgi:polysaccharide export outer membrane protein
VFFTSCIPTQDLIYLQNKNNSDVANTISAVESKPYRLQTNDIISITIKAIDPKLVAMFNPTNEGICRVNQIRIFILMVYIG